MCPRFLGVHLAPNLAQSPHSLYNVTIESCSLRTMLHDMLVKALLVCIFVLYHSGHLFDVVKVKHGSRYNSLKLQSNCTYPNLFFSL